MEIPTRFRPQFRPVFTPNSDPIPTPFPTLGSIGDLLAKMVGRCIPFFDPITHYAFRLVTQVDSSVQNHDIEAMDAALEEVEDVRMQL